MTSFFQFFWSAHFSYQSKECYKDRVTQTKTSSEDTLFRSTFQKMSYGCLSVKLELHRYEAEACYEDLLEHAENNNLEIAYLAREMFMLQESFKMRYFLQETCQKNALSCKILRKFFSTRVLAKTNRRGSN